MIVNKNKGTAEGFLFTAQASRNCKNINVSVHFLGYLSCWMSGKLVRSMTMFSLTSQSHVQPNKWYPGVLAGLCVLCALCPVLINWLWWCNISDIFIVSYYNMEHAQYSMYTFIYILFWATVYIYIYIWTVIWWKCFKSITLELSWNVLLW